MLNTIKKIASKIWQYLSLVDDIAIDFLTDLKSLRYQLILWGFILNVWVIRQVVCCNLHYSISITCIGLLTLVFGMYFQSKAKQAEMENQQPASEEDPLVERDPEL